MKTKSTPKTKKIKKPSVSKLHKKLWAIFSLYIRLNESKDGIGTCITCGVKKPYKELQAGHFISRRFKATLYDEMNVHSQCFACNCFLHGNLLRYRRVMDDLYGDEAVYNMEQKAKEIKQWKAFELEDLIRYYTNEVSSLTC